MTKIACLSQRPIQTLILIYLLGEKNYKFDLVIFSPIKKNNNIGSYKENDSSYETLKYQCKILDIPIVKVSSLNSDKILRLQKKFRIKAALGLISDTIIKKKILDAFSRGIFMSHGGVLPSYRGVDCNKWAYLEKSKFAGISLIKLSQGIDDGDILYVKKILIKKKKIKDLERELYYRHKLYLYKKIFIELKQNKKLKFIKQKKVFQQYFKMHKHLESIVTKT